MLGFNCFRSATETIAGIEITHMIRKGQIDNMRKATYAEQFYSLTG